MKKFLSLVVVTSSITLSSNANAKDGIYVGADLLFANSNHEYQDRSYSEYYNDYNGAKTQDNSLGFAIDVGYKLEFDDLFVAPELFFDQLNNSSYVFKYKEYPSNKRDNIDLNYRYGAKLNFGYNITPKLNAFITYGFANVDYDTKTWYAGGRKAATTELEKLYGLGFGLKISDQVTARLSYDRQSMNLRNIIITTPDGNSARYKTSLDTVKIGAIYSF